MKIGLVSADKHCKSHISALRKDGYNVTCLGARPTSIPVSYDALIVRVASISHAGEAVARAWAKETGNPAIYADGLSGIRRDLAALRATGGAVEEASPPDIFAKLLGCAESYREARPDDGHEDMARALRGVITTEHPDLPERQRRSMVPSIIARFFPTTSTAPPEKTMPKIELPSYVGSPALLPANTGWAKVYAEPKVRNAYNEAVVIITDANHLTITSFTEGVKVGVFSRKVKTRWESLLRGKPLTAAFVMFMLLPDLTKQEGMQAYRLITDKGMDSRLKDVVEWALGIAEGGVPPEAVVPAKTAAPESDPRDWEAVGSNTEAILTLMDDLSTFKNEIRALIEVKVKVLDDSHRQVFKGLQTFASESGAEYHTVVDRIKALEAAMPARLSGDDVSLMAGLEARKAVEAMGEELRSDISNAFDARAAEAPVYAHSGQLGDYQAASNPASNPLAALEQVKAALKAAGFKGTLTLTIE